MMAPTLTKSYPTVYVLSQIPHLYQHIKNLANENMVVKLLNTPEKFDKNLTLNMHQIDFIKDAEIVIGDSTLLAKSYCYTPKLKWAHCTWAGIEPFMSSIKQLKVTPSFILTRHGSSAFSMLMAEYVICQILNWEKKMALCWRGQQQKMWMHTERFESTARSLSSLVICILGVGNMGCGVAKQLKNFGSKLFGYSHFPRSAEAKEYAFFDRISTDLAELLPECDYLCNTLPNTPETCGLLNGYILNMCKKKPVFINVGRGDIIEEQYIIQAIRHKVLSGAILDVFKEEPLPESSKLWDMPEVIITPHIAAISTAEHVAQAFMDNYNKYVAGEPLENVVNWSAGY